MTQLTQPIIQCRSVNLAVPGKTILRDLSFSVSPGSFVVVIGENGAGKTSLLKLLMGFSPPTSGSLLVMGKNPTEDPFQDRHQIAYLAERLSPPIDWSVEEYLTFNRFFYPHYSISKEEELLKLFRINKTARVGQLSTGERRRIQVVGGLAYHPQLLLVDEITAVLDIVGRSQFMALLRKIREAGGTILMATNIVDDVDSYATHLLLLHEGRLLYSQSKEQFLQDRNGMTLAAGIAEEIAKQMEIHLL